MNKEKQEFEETEEFNKEEFNLMDMADLENEKEEELSTNLINNTEKAIKSSLFSSLTLFSLISTVISLFYARFAEWRINAYFRHITDNLTEQRRNVDYGTRRANELDFYIKHLNSIIATVVIILLLVVAYMVTKKVTKNITKWMYSSKTKSIVYVIYITLTICLALTFAPESYLRTILAYVPSLGANPSITALFSAILLFSILCYLSNRVTRRGLSTVTTALIFILAIVLIEYLPIFIFRNMLPYSILNYYALILVYFLIKLIYQMLKIRTLSNDFDDYQDFIEETIQETNNKNAIIMHKMFNQETTVHDIARYLAILSYF